jgi:class 3 adenylate cyclase
MSRRSHFDEFFRLNGPSEFSCKTLVLVLDAERAARPALSIQQALADLHRKNAGAGKPELGARIGLETGPAVADGEPARFTAMSPTLRRGRRRAQALAEPGAVMVTAWVSMARGTPSGPPFFAICYSHDARGRIDRL